MAFITAATRSNIVELAMGMLNQAPSTTLLNTLIEKSTAGSSLQDLADYIATTDAFTAEYPSTQTAKEFATEMFGKLITGGTVTAAINTAVIDLLEGLLTTGTTKAQGFVAVINYLKDTANNTNADLGDIAKAFQNRADAAEYFSVTKELGGSTATELAAAIATVTSDAATLTAANTAADATSAAVPAIAALTSTLTKDLDSTVLGAGDDTANSANTATVTSLNSGDTLAGGDGIDTLAISNTSANAALGAGATVSAVEKISINAVAATTLDMSLFTGVTDIFNNGSLSDLTVSGVGSYIPNIHLTASSADTTVTWASAATTVGTGDEMTVALNAAANSSSATLTANGIETFNVLASGASGTATNSQTLVSPSARSVVITGDATTNLTVDLAGAGATTALAGNVTGNSAANIMSVTADSTDKISVDMKGGNDTLAVTNIGALYTLAGGDGTDTLSVSQAIATAASATATISGFSTLDVSTAGTGIIDMDDFEGGFTKVVYNAGLGGATTVDDAVTGIEVEVDVTAGAQNLTVDLKTDGAADAITVTLDAIGVGDNIGTINAADAETLTISVDDDTTTATGTVGIAAITLGDAKSVIISGDAATTITTFTNPTTSILTSFNASGMTDNLTMSGLNLAAAGGTITLGSGDDTLTMATGNGADTVDLSAGGKNTVVYTALAQSDAAGMDIVKGFVSGSDDIDLRGMAGRNITTSTQFGGVGATKTAAEGLLGGTNSAMAVYQADDAILWVDINGDGALTAADFRLNLEGVATIAATDLKIGSAGNTLALTAASAVVNTTTSTNASKFSTNEGDTITSSAASIAGSTIDGAQGADTLTITSGTVAVDLSAAAGTLANIEAVVTASGVSALTVAAGDTGTGTGNLSSITGLAGTAQILNIAATDDLTDVTIRNFETLHDGDANVGATYTLDADNLTSVTAITLDGGTADTISLADGTYDLSAIALTGTAASTLDLNADGNLAKTLTADAADLAMFTTITGEGTAGIVTTINVNDDDSWALNTVTAIDVVTIGTAANTDQALTINGDDFTTTNFTTVTGSGDDDIILAVGAGAGAVSLVNTTISGVDLVNTDAAIGGNVALTLDAASIAGTFTLSSHVNADLTFSEDSDYSNMTIAAGDFDNITVATGVDLILSELAFAGSSTIATLVGVNGGAAETITVNMATTGTLDFTLLTTLTDITMTVNDTTGADTIDMAIAGAATDSALAGTTINLANGGADTINVDNDALAADATGLTVQNFTAGSGAGSDKLVIVTTNATVMGNYLAVSAAATASADIDGNFVEIQAAVATVSDLTATGDGLAVETAIATALGTSTADNSGGTNGEFLVAIYGGGAAAGDVGIYEVLTAANNADIVTGNIVVELIAILDGGITQDALVSSNFI